MNLPKPVNRRGFLQQAAAIGMTVVERTPAPASAAGVQLRDFGLTEQFFLDPTLADSVQGLTVTVHRPKKMGLIQEADGRPWEMGDQHSVVRDGSGRFHMVYRLICWDPTVRDLHAGIRNDPAHWFREYCGYATSADGIRWNKPVLDLVDGPSGFRRAPRERWKDGVFFEPTGYSKHNNLGCPIANLQDLGEFGGVSDPKHRYLINVLRKDDTHPFANIVDGGLYFAAEVPDIANDPDWRKKLETIWVGPHRGARGPVTRVAGFDEQSKVWIECAQCTFGNIVKLNGRCLSRWSSRDLRQWSPEELVLPIAADESRLATDWVEYMDVRVNRLGDLWLGQMVVYHGDRSTPQSQMPTQPRVWRKGTTELRLIVSRDAGKSWQRVGGTRAWLPHHEAEDGYDRMIFVSSPVRVGDELWFYYGAWDGDHLSWNRDHTPYYKDRVRIGRTAWARMRWNGYLSLRGEREVGQVTTQPFLTNGKQLRVNTAAGKGGVRVEVQDVAGKPLPDYRQNDCVELTENGLSQRVRWRDNSELPQRAKERPLRLRFAVRQADLYGFQLTL